MEIDIVYQDENYLVINKPAGVVTNRAESVAGETIQDWSEAYLKIAKPAETATDLEKLFYKRSGLAHRLDKETSGCLVIAKEPEALSFILKQFAERKVKKEYLALVHGLISPSEGVVRLPLQRSKFDRERFQVHFSGKVAETAWQVEELFPKQNLSLVRLKPKTGRTHQIRVHMSHLGYPLFADERYLRKDFLIADRERLPFHFLHSAKISFKSIDGKLVEASAPLTSEQQRLLSWIKNG